MTRGELARRCAVNAATIRYYEQRGLLPEPSRTASNYRLYEPAAVRRVRFIKRAQALGFTLSEIKELLALRADPGARAADVRARTRDKIRDVDAKIEALTAIGAALRRLEADCTGRGSASDCPILDAIDTHTGD